MQRRKMVGSRILAASTQSLCPEISLYSDSFQHREGWSDLAKMSLPRCPGKGLYLHGKRIRDLKHNKSHPPMQTECVTWKHSIEFAFLRICSSTRNSKTGEPGFKQMGNYFLLDNEFKGWWHGCSSSVVRSLLSVTYPFPRGHQTAATAMNRMSQLGQKSRWVRGEPNRYLLTSH